MKTFECNKCGEFLPTNWRCECTLPSAQQKPSLSDEESAKKHGRPSPSWRDSETTKRIDQGKVGAFLAGCQHKEASLRGELENLRTFSDYWQTSFASLRTSSGKELASALASIAEYEKDYAEWVEDRHALGKEIERLERLNRDQAARLFDIENPGKKWMPSAPQNINEVSNKSIKGLADAD